MQQAPAPDPDSRTGTGHGLARAFLVLAVVGAIGFAIVTLIRAFAGGGDGTAAEPSAIPDQYLPMDPGASALVVAGHDGDEHSRVTLGDVIDGFTHPSNQFQAPAAGRRWWGIYITVENTGETGVLSLRYRLRLEDEEEYEPRFIAGVPGMIEYTYNGLTPGASKEGWLFFEIPEDGRVDALRVDGRRGPGGQQPPAVYFEAP